MVVTEKKSSVTILDEAVEAWSNTEKERRDSYIRVGTLLAEYVLARLLESDEIPYKRRLAFRLTREKIIKDAADRLSIKPGKVSELIRVAKTVEFFGDPKELSYSSIRAFSVFVNRKKGKLTRHKQSESGMDLMPSEKEQWMIVPTKSVPDPLSLYRQAAEEGWLSSRIRAITRIRTSSGAVRPAESVTDRRSEGNSTVPYLGQIAREADPRDLADMIVEMVQNCPRQETLKRLLIDRIKL